MRVFLRFDNLVSNDKKAQPMTHITARLSISRRSFAGAAALAAAALALPALTRKTNSKKPKSPCLSVARRLFITCP